MKIIDYGFVIGNLLFAFGVGIVVGALFVHCPPVVLNP